jgi:predicted ATP-grasp superfamily ATP-dependent carboligase
VPGPASNHYFVDGFLDRTGQVRARLVRRRLRMYPTDFGNSSYMRTVPAEEAGTAVETIESLLAAVGFRGIYSAEFKRDERDGVFRLLEVNARPWWYVEFAARCGVDVVWMAYLDALERPVPTQLEYELDRALVFPRYDLFACLEGLRAGELTWGTCVRSWVGGDRPIFSWDDPLPALREAFRNARGSVGRRVRPRHRDVRP